MNLQLDGHTQLLCLLGHPVSHSISPKMHNESFSKLGLNMAYLAFDTTPEKLPDMLHGLKAQNFLGCNLTMPLKTAVIPYLDELSQAAKLSQSVNTILHKDGRLIGHTTDGIGYMDSLTDQDFHVIGEHMTILGAGGAATSIITEAALQGVKKIYVMKRQNASYPQTVAFAEMITRETNCEVIVRDQNDPDALKASIADSLLLTNATNVGMEEDQRSLVPPEFLRKDLLVSDIIYHPEMTTLLKDAKEAGARYMNGKYMLLFQGAASFQIWTGEKMPISYIKETCFS